MKKNEFLRNVAITACAVVTMSSCSGEETLNSRGTHSTFTKELDASASVSNAQAGSTATFQLSAIVEEKTLDGIGGYQRFTPTLKLEVKLEKTNIETDKVGEISMTGSEIVNETPFEDGNTFGKDAVKKFYFSDGQVATASYSWRYQKGTIGTTTITSPYMEITAIEYDSYSYADGTITLKFKANCQSRNSDNILSENVELQPWYIHVPKKSVETDKVGDAVWSHEIIWGEGEEEGYITMRVTKTIPHTLAEDEVFTWDRQVHIVAGQKKDGKWYVADTWTDHKVIDPTEEQPETWNQDGWTITQTNTVYKYVFSYRTGGGVFSPDLTIKIGNVDVTFQIEDKTFTFKTDVKLGFKSEIVNDNARKALYEGEKYLSTDKLNFTYTDHISGKEWKHTAYVDLIEE